jgi:hypothetical protein
MMHLTCQLTLAQIKVYHFKDSASSLPPGVLQIRACFGVLALRFDGAIVKMLQAESPLTAASTDFDRWIHGTILAPQTFEIL